MIHVSDCITLADFDHPYEWYVAMNEYGVFECTSHNAEMRQYRLEKLPHQLTDSERTEILDCCLGAGNYGYEERVSVGDIFRHGKYTTKI